LIVSLEVREKNTPAVYLFSLSCMSRLPTEAVTYATAVFTDARPFDALLAAWSHL